MKKDLNIENLVVVDLKKELIFESKPNLSNKSLDIGSSILARKIKEKIDNGSSINEK